MQDIQTVKAYIPCEAGKSLCSLPSEYRVQGNGGWGTHSRIDLFVERSGTSVGHVQMKIHSGKPAGHASQDILGEQDSLKGSLQFDPLDGG